MARVLVTRPQPGASRTLEALRAKGIDAQAISLTEIQPLAVHLTRGDFDALVITSQNAILHGSALIEKFTRVPVFVVGKRTAAMLEDRGHNVAAWAKTAQELLPLIRTKSPKVALYVCGTTRRPDLEFGLAAANIQVQASEVYSALPAQNAGRELTDYFSKDEPGFALLYAPSAASAFVSAFDGKKPPTGISFLCLSAAVAAQLPKGWQAKAVIAAEPHEAAMFDQLDKMLAYDHLPKA
jgi:uroporphyrinogen-III synthase